MSGFPVRCRLFAFVLGVALVLPCLSPAAVQAATPPGKAVLAAGTVGESWLGQMWERLTAAPRRPPVRRFEGCGIDPNGHCVKKFPVKRSPGD